MKDNFTGSIVEIENEYYYISSIIGSSMWDKFNIVVVNIDTGNRKIIHRKDLLIEGGKIDIKFIVANLFTLRTKFITNNFNREIINYVCGIRDHGMIETIDVDMFNRKKTFIKDFIKSILDDSIILENFDNNIIKIRLQNVLVPKKKKLDVPDWDLFKFYCRIK